jgi:hypothetical protein
MKTQQLAGLLCCVCDDRAVKRISPPWCDEELVRCAFAEVTRVRHQRDELVALWPNRKEELDCQCNDTIMKIAGELNEKLQPDYEP